MFTGLVEEAGTVAEVAFAGQSARIKVHAPLVSQDSKVGDSVAVNGCCLTAIEVQRDVLTFDAVPETLARTNLACLKMGHRVNLERPLQVGCRLGGHFVQGHIDAVASILGVVEQDNAVIIEIEIPDRLGRYIVVKGSIAVDGVSLTVAELRPQSFTVWTIPHTRAVTTLGARRTGDLVNIECDLLAKHIERLLMERDEQHLA